MSRYSNITTNAISSSSSVGGSVTELKLYQAFIFSVPVFFTFILLFLFYLFYLRPRRVDWDSLRMRTSSQDVNQLDELSRAEMGGVKKEVREMLPIIVYKESFSVNDTQCPVCLGDYQAEDRLQQIPACGHTFHMDCIDHWLANHTTCPLCRLSLLVSAKSPTGSMGNGVQESSVSGSNNGIPPIQPLDHRALEDSAAVEHFDSTNGNFGVCQDNCGTEDCVIKIGVGCNS